MRDFQIAMTEGQKAGNPDWGLWQSWLDAWNRRDLEGIVAHYAEDVEFVSQSVVDLGMGAAGSLRGKSALRDVFGAGLKLDVNLVFTPMEVVAVMLSVLTVVVLSQNGQTNWFEGVLLLGLYAILAVAFFYLPDAAHAAAGASSQPVSAH